MDENGVWQKYFNITDHLGSVRSVVKASNGAIVGEYDYKPFGEKLAVTGEDNPRLSFINKERDFESSLGDFGVRKYEDGLGRFTTCDPLFEKYYGWSPYHYCRNNPIILYDNNGKFDMEIHSQITQIAIESVGGLGFLDLGAQIVIPGVAAVDVYNASISEQHYDNSNFKQGDNFVNSNLSTGGYYDLSEALHARQDFYSHSNYVELASGYFKGEKNVPIFQEAMKNKGFAELWAKEGKSGNYPNNDNDPNSHEKMNKDNSKKRYFKKAKALATQETIIILSNWKKEHE